MIRFVRTGQVSERNMAEATQWARELIEYMNAHFPEQNGQMFWQRFDVPTVTFYYMADYEDIASLDRFLKGQGADEGLQELYSRAADVFIEDVGELVVLESV